MATQERIRYVSQTKHEILMELATGSGDHVIALAELFGCNKLGVSHFPGIMRRQHSVIFNESTVNDGQVITQIMTESVANSLVLADNCNPELI